MVGLLSGAGLPALFAIGLRALRGGQPPDASVAEGATQTAGADADRVYGGNPVGLAVAVICFPVILAALG